MSKEPHISTQQLPGYLSAEENFLLLVVRTGGRSALATLTLKDTGYTNVVDLDGGFKEWVAEGNTFYNLHGENRVVSYQKNEYGLQLGWPFCAIEAFFPISSIL